MVYLPPRIFVYRAQNVVGSAGVTLSCRPSKNISEAPPHQLFLGGPCHKVRVCFAINQKKTDLHAMHQQPFRAPAPSPKFTFPRFTNIKSKSFVESPFVTNCAPIFAWCRSSRPPCHGPSMGACEAFLIQVALTSMLCSVP